MRKIVFFISGTWSSSISKMIEEGDIVLCAPGLKPPKGISHIELPISLDENARDVANWIAGANASSELILARNCIDCFLNDYYSYSIKPLVALMLGLKSWIDSSRVCEVLIVSARTSGKRIPLVGFRTSESLRGSPNLLNSRLNELLPLVFPETKFRFEYVRGDLLCYEGIRRLVIGSVNIACSLILIAKTLWFNWRREQVEHGTRLESVVLVRTEHHLRFAHRLLKDSSAAGLVILPQVSQGLFSSLVRFSRNAPAEIPKLGITPLMAFRAFTRSLREIAELKKFSRNARSQVLMVAGLKIPLQISDVADEIRLVWAVLLYKNILSQLLKIAQPARLVNFELVGRMAGLEALAARENGVDSLTVQTALISSAPHPIFPHSNRFFVDSATTLSMISENGSRKKGEVAYAGPPYSLGRMRAVDVFRDVVFFSQPYEHAVAIRIISKLCHWVRPNGGRVTLRLHPRDKLLNYESLFETFADVLNLEKGAGVAAVINSHDLCITRTSSVAKEAIAMGVPVLLCLWSDFDRSVKADYIANLPSSRYCSYFEEDFLSVLSDSKGLISSAGKLSELMFAGKTMTNLMATLCLDK